MSRIPKYLPIIAGHEEAFERDFLKAHRIAKGKLGWSGQAKMFVWLNLDKQMFGGKGKKRVRIKKMKRQLKKAFLEQVLSHLRTPSYNPNVPFRMDPDTLQVTADPTSPGKFDVKVELRQGPFDADT